MVEEFLISELAERAGVTIRTIRYYTSEGLLPDPIRRGSRYYYTQEHVDRLELIDRLKRRYLPLQEIKRILALTSTEDVSNLLEMQDTFAEVKPARPQMFREQSSARDYIDGLISSPEWNPISNPEWDPKRGPLPTRGHHKTQPPDILPAPAPEPKGETWTHISLFPGVELHVLEGLNPEIKKRVEELVQYALKLLESKGTK